MSVLWLTSPKSHFLYNHREKNKRKKKEKTREVSFRGFFRTSQLAAWSELLPHPPFSIPVCSPWRLRSSLVASFLLQETRADISKNRNEQKCRCWLQSHLFLRTSFEQSHSATFWVSTHAGRPRFCSTEISSLLQRTGHVHVNFALSKSSFCWSVMQSPIFLKVVYFFLSPPWHSSV